MLDTFENNMMLSAVQQLTTEVQRVEGKVQKVANDVAALPEIPTPAIADAGKVLGVDESGDYALVEGGGGGGGAVKFINVHYNLNVLPEGAIDYVEELFSPSDNIIAFALRFPGQTTVLPIVQYKTDTVSVGDGYFYYNEDGTTTSITQDTDVLFVDFGQDSFTQQLVIDVSTGKCLYLE